MCPNITYTVYSVNKLLKHYIYCVFLKWNEIILKWNEIIDAGLLVDLLACLLAGLLKTTDLNSNKKIKELMVLMISFNDKF